MVTDTGSDTGIVRTTGVRIWLRDDRAAAGTSAACACDVFVCLSRFPLTWLCCGLVKEVRCSL